MSRLWLVLALGAFAAGAWLARYELVPVGSGAMRLDRFTGEVTTCIPYSPDPCDN